MDALTCDGLNFFLQFFGNSGGGEEEFHQIALGVEVHFDGGVNGVFAILCDGNDHGNFEGIGYKGFDEDIAVEGVVVERIGFAEDGHTFTVVTAFACFHYDGIAGELADEFIVDVLGIAEGEGCCGDVVLGEKLLLESFVLNDLKDSGFWDDGFAFFFECYEGVDVDVFDFPGNDIGLVGEVADIVGVVEAALDEVVGDGCCWTVGRLFKYSKFHRQAGVFCFYCHHAQLAATDNTNAYHGTKIRAARNTKFGCCDFCHIFGGIFVIV